MGVLVVLVLIVVVVVIWKNKVLGLSLESNNINIFKNPKNINLSEHTLRFIFFFIISIRYLLSDKQKTGLKIRHSLASLERVK